MEGLLEEAEDEQDYPDFPQSISSDRLSDHSKPTSPYLRHHFPRRYARKDFPLLFPKSKADEQAIRLIAQLTAIDYDSLKAKLEQVEVPEANKLIFK